jgi:Tol biopolymer transport system component
MQLGRFTWLFLLAGVAALAAVAVMLFTPRPLSVEPAPDAADVPPNLPLRITFSQPMRADSVPSRLVITPAVAGKITWQGDALIFTPDHGWPGDARIQVELKPGAVSSLGLPVRQPLAWSFTVHRARIAYLSPAGGQASLYAVDAGGEQPPRQLIPDQGILDFSIDPKAGVIYYSLPNASGGSDLYAYDLAHSARRMVLACPQSICKNPQPSPDGRWLAYEQSPFSTAQAASVRVWLLPLSGGPPRLAGDPAHTTYSPAWSSQGWLALYDSSRQGYVVIQPGQGEKAFFANRTGDLGSWSPDGYTFLAGDMASNAAATAPVDRAQTASLPSRILAYESGGGRTRPLTDGSFEDVSPVWSPDGRRIAFARRFLDAPRWTPGRQLWLMDANGSRPVQLTDSTNDDHSSFAWSPDGKKLAFVRFNNLALTQPPSLWVITLDSGELVKLADSAYSPVWIP